MDKEVRSLKRACLKIGGSSFQVPGVIERDLCGELARKDWQHQDGAGARLMKMRACSCHENAAILAIEKNWTCITGMALSADGCWRVHSWAMNQRGRVVETTVPRVAYYGVMLNREATEGLL
jgi:hypothetical protein